MATNNNLTDFLTAVADAIREKNGTTDAINPQDMPGMIASIGGTAVDFTTADNSDTNVSALCTSIANAIRAKKSYDSTKLINPQDFPEEIRGIVTRSYMTVTASTATRVTVDEQEIIISANTETELTPTTSFMPGYAVRVTVTYTGENLTAINCSNLDTSGFTSMKSMFYKCKNVPTLSVGGFNTEKVTDMRWLFYQCAAVTLLDVSNFNTKNVTTMYAMFGGCQNVTSLNVSNFNTSRVTSMAYMFYYCPALTSLNVSNFNTAKVTNMTYMFYYSLTKCYSLDVSSFDLTNVTNISHMFGYCSTLHNIIFGSGWGKQTSTATDAITLDLASDYCNYVWNYEFTPQTFNSMLTMYDRATAGLTNMTIKVNNTTNAPENWTANIQARGYTITVG